MLVSRYFYCGIGNFGFAVWAPGPTDTEHHWVGSQLGFKRDSLRGTLQGYFYVRDKYCSLQEYFKAWSIVGFHGLGPTEFY